MNKPAEPSPEVKQEETCACGHVEHCMGARTYCLIQGCGCPTFTPRPSPEVAPTQGEPEKMAFDALRKILLRDYGAGEAAYYLGFLTGLEKQLSRLKAVPAVAPRETQGELQEAERILEAVLESTDGATSTWHSINKARKLLVTARLENGGR